MSSAEQAGGPAALEQAETQLASIAPGYLERVRDAAQRIGAGDVRSNDSAAALQAIEDMSDIDVEVPTLSRRPIGRIVKTAVVRAVGWYMRYLGSQISALGLAVSHFGGTLLDRTERLEQENAAIRSDLAELAARIDRLEHDRPPS